VSKSNLIIICLAPASNNEPSVTGATKEERATNHSDTGLFAVDRRLTHVSCLTLSPSSSLSSTPCPKTGPPTHDFVKA